MVYRWSCVRVVLAFPSFLALGTSESGHGSVLALAAWLVGHLLPISPVSAPRSFGEGFVHVQEVVAVSILLHALGIH